MDKATLFEQQRELIGVEVCENYNIEDHYLIDFKDIYQVVKEEDKSSYGFEQPSFVQQLATIPLLLGNDCIIQAQSGSGKTASFLTPLMMRIDQQQKNTQAVVITHSRELSEQIYNIACQMFNEMGLSIALQVGGLKQHYYRNKHSQNEYQEQVVICTPGRLLDLLGHDQFNNSQKKKRIDVSSLKMLVLDEADELLSQGFLEDIKVVISQFITPQVQICLLSATLPIHILNITNNFMNDKTIRITIAEKKVNLDGILQYKVQCEKDEMKTPILIELLKRLQDKIVIVFVNNKLLLDNLVLELKNEKLKALGIHGNMEQEIRFKIKKEFEQTGGILVTTDLLSRGIDIITISYVFNYDVPHNAETYIHRIGRTGRYGKKGYAITLITEQTDRKLIEHCQKFNISIKDLSDDFDKN